MRYFLSFDKTAIIKYLSITTPHYWVMVQVQILLLLIIHSIGICFIKVHIHKEQIIWGFLLWRENVDFGRVQDTWSLLKFSTLPELIKFQVKKIENWVAIIIKLKESFHAIEQ